MPHRSKQKTRAEILRRQRSASTIACLCLNGAIVSQRAMGGTRRDDVADSSYQALGNATDYAAVGSVLSQVSAGLYGGTGVLISNQWVLTAGHMLRVQFSQGSTIEDARSVTYNPNGTNYAAEEWLPHPDFSNSTLSNGFDIGLIHLSIPVTNVVPVTRYYGISEQGQVGTIVGFGFSGTGLTGEQNGTYGTKRGWHKPDRRGGHGNRLQQ